MDSVSDKTSPKNTESTFHFDEHRSEDKERKENQKAVKKRERQWQTVGDSSEDELEPVSSRDDHDDHKHKHARKDPERHESSHHKSGRRHDEDSSDDDSSDSDGSSDESSKDHKKHKKHSSSSHSHKKHKKEKKEKKSHKSKKSKSHKKEKKHKKEKDKEDKHPTISIDQNEYGKYGIIREEHFYQKQR
jgi:hypothetical protein